jgi:quinohemoprotein ethanol dehydrogenase
MNMPSAYFRIVAALLLFYVASSDAAYKTDALVANVKNSDQEWLSIGKDYREQRFSPLKQINDQNVSQLKLEWEADFPTNRAMESTPLVHDGKLYVTLPWGYLYAFDAKTGTELWNYDSSSDRANLINMCCGPVNRGPGLWVGDDGVTRIFMATLDGRLLALNAGTGELLWEVQVTPAGKDSQYSITGPARVIQGKVMVGSSGGEYGVRGFFTAYDAITGEMAWRFYTVPRDPLLGPQEQPELEMALKTWTGELWKKTGGGGTVWDGMVYDPELDLLYVAIGNGTPWNRELRSPGGGDDLFLNSIVAVKPGTGEYVWHFQVTPNDNWDYTGVQQLVLAELEIEGVPRDVIMQAPKNGFYFVLDRHTGELISAEPYASINWATHWDYETNRPVETEIASYQNYENGTILLPGPVGAHNWQPMAYSPDTRLTYIPVQHVPVPYKKKDPFEYTLHRWNTGTDDSALPSISNWVLWEAALDALIYGRLVAWDPVEQKEAWSVRLPSASNGGVLATAGNLVFQGNFQGEFVAYNASNGNKLWQHQTDGPIVAAAMSYEIDGQQYIAITQGGGGVLQLAFGRPYQTTGKNTNRLMVFKLNGKGLPERPVDTVGRAPVPLIAERNTDPKLIARGYEVFMHDCVGCHGINAAASNAVPDLRYRSPEIQTIFSGVVGGGALEHEGMVGFFETANLEDIQALRAFLDMQQISINEMGDNPDEKSLWQKIQYWFFYGFFKIVDKFPSLLNIAS